MARTRTLVTGWAMAGALTGVFAGCMHNHAALLSRTAGGDIVVDSLSASRTALLRIQNDYPSEVRVYTVIDGKPNYVAKAMPGETRTFVLDPNLFPNAAISFETRRVDGKTPSRLGPYNVNKGETVELVVAADFDMTRASVHHSSP